MPLQYVCDRCRVALDLTGCAAGDVMACPYCGQTFVVPGNGAPAAAAAAAPTPTASRLKKRQAKSEEMFAAVAGLVVFAALAVTCGGCLVWPTAPRAPNTRVEVESELRSLAIEAVKRRLAFPNNAHFHWSMDVRQSQAEPGIWYVAGQVDAKNAFGATLTYDWICEYALIEKGPPRRYDLRGCNISP
jgi:DNA-directed RNA polymerase subunit RPC12/RpoP